MGKRERKDRINMIKKGNTTREVKHAGQQRSAKSTRDGENKLQPRGAAARSPTLCRTRETTKRHCQEKLSTFKSLKGKVILPFETQLPCVNGKVTFVRLDPVCL